MKWVLLLCAAGLAGAQPVQVYSDQARIDSTSGAVLAPANPREILSPALARNAFSSFQISVQVAKGSHYWLHLGQNPDNAVKITLYRETGDKLDRVDLPVEGNATQVFWMDVWTERTAPVRRIKIEPQLNIANDWVVYPMEARVMESTTPDANWPAGAAPPMAAMRGFVCDTKVAAPAAAPGPSIPAFRYRNGQQDVAMARSAPREALRKLLGRCDAAPPDDPEFYLRFRDYLFRMR